MEDRRRYDDSTRDIAIEGKSLITQHMTDCTRFREDLSEALSEMRADIKSLMMRTMMIVGGMIALSKAVEIGISILKK